MAETLSDATLLERFATERQESAFATLVRRHGPRVERICRDILRNEHDVEDVIQATFLVLARKAGAIDWHESVGHWIDGVARRLALHARSGAARQFGREKAFAALFDGPSSDRDRNGWLPERLHPRVEPSSEVERRDLRRVLDDELLRLPEKYRAPVVLCDLEGHTREEAARQLGWPTGSMSRRLDRARSLLRERLTHRGVALGVIGLASMAIAVAFGMTAGGDRRASSLRTALAPGVSCGADGNDLGILTAIAESDGTTVDFARILPAARAAASAARRLEGREPVESAPLWRQLAAVLRDSARDLERACDASDADAVVAAARRIDASCVQCHAVFRRSSASAGKPCNVVTPDASRSADLPETTDPKEIGGLLAGQIDDTAPPAGSPYPLIRTTTHPGWQPGGSRPAPASRIDLIASNEGPGHAVLTEGVRYRGAFPGFDPRMGAGRPPEPLPGRADRAIRSDGWVDASAC